METLFTPWRARYVRGRAQPPGCFFCAAAADPEEPERLVVHLTERYLVMLNRYPYTSGHLMVAPRRHLATPDAGDAATRAELWDVVLATRRVLERVYRPDGFNLGMNLGRAAGAGVPDHIHFHVVPRWAGDTNFMGAVGDVRVVPEEPLAARERLRRAFAGAEVEGG